MRARDAFSHGELVDHVLALYHCGVLEPQVSHPQALRYTLRELRRFAKRVVDAERPDA